MHSNLQLATPQKDASCQVVEHPGFSHQIFFGAWKTLEGTSSRPRGTFGLAGPGVKKRFHRTLENRKRSETKHLGGGFICCFFLIF